MQTKVFQRTLCHMSPKRVGDLLDRTGVSHPCDLELLLFFHRHPRAFLTSERLAVYVGYELAQVARSLDTLIAMSLVTRVSRPTTSARMYVLNISGPLGGWLEALLRLVSTRKGRLAVMATLTQRRPARESPSPGGTEPRARSARERTVRNALEVRHA